MDKKALMERARKAAELAYAPYSNFRVGAALLCEDGTVVTGGNVENRSFGLTICAERSAVLTALSEGKSRFVALAVSCPDADYPVSPCGACRQVLSEFAAATLAVHFAGRETTIQSTTLGELLPFDALHDLKKERAPRSNGRSAE